MDRFGLFYSHFLTILSHYLLSSLGSDENSATIFILFLPCLKCPCPLATFRFFSSSLLFCSLTLNVAKCDFLFVLASWFYRLLSIIQFGNFLSNASCFNYFLPGPLYQFLLDSCIMWLDDVPQVTAAPFIFFIYFLSILTRVIFTDLSTSSLIFLFTFYFSLLVPTNRF